MHTESLNNRCKTLLTKISSRLGLTSIYTIHPTSPSEIVIDNSIQLTTSPKSTTASITTGKINNKYSNNKESSNK